MTTVDRFIVSSQPAQLTRYVALLQRRMTQYGNDDVTEVKLKRMLKQEKEMSRHNFQI